MSTHNIHFHGAIRQISKIFGTKMFLIWSYTDACLIINSSDSLDDQSDSVD